VITAAVQFGVYVIGVDTDQYLIYPEAAPPMLTSAIKLITPGVFHLIKLSKDGQFPSGNYFGDVGYTPFHDLENEVPVSVKKMMEQIRAGLLSGSIKTKETKVFRKMVPDTEQPIYNSNSSVASCFVMQQRVRTPSGNSTAGKKVKINHNLRSLSLPLRDPVDKRLSFSPSSARQKTGIAQSWSANVIVSVMFSEKCRLNK